MDKYLGVKRKTGPEPTEEPKKKKGKRVIDDEEEEEEQEQQQDQKVEPKQEQEEKEEQEETEQEDKKKSGEGSSTGSSSKGTAGGNGVKQITSMDELEMALDPSWRKLLKGEFEKPYFKKLKKYLATEITAHGENGIFPPKQDIFNAFNHCTLDKVKVVILGQDPYQTPGFAHGLAFSVKPGVVVPKSLINIYKELESDIKGFKRPNHGTLTKWADQGVLLLNTVLTVRKSIANSHQKQGWEQFTEAAFNLLNKEKKGIVFILWGKPAQAKGKQIDKKKHLVLESAHPSPLSATRGFFGCKHFSKCNAYLKKNGEDEIDWQV